MKPSDFIHPEDAAALRQMESFAPTVAPRPTATPSFVLSVERSWNKGNMKAVPYI